MKLKDLKNSLGDIENLINKHIATQEGVKEQDGQKKSRFQRFKIFIKKIFSRKAD